MASFPDPAGPATLPDATRDDHSDSDPEIEATIESDPIDCTWTNAQHHDRECSRYFDCPSHTIERRLSVGQADGEEMASPQRAELRDESAHANIYDDADSSIRGSSPERSGGVDSDVSTPSLPGQVAASEEDNLSHNRPGEPVDFQNGPTPSNTMDQPEESQSSWLLAQSQPSNVSLGSSEESAQRQSPSPNSRPLPQSPPLSPSPSPGPTQRVAPPRQTSLPVRAPQARVPVSPRQNLPRPPRRSGDSNSSDLLLPRWQPDAEVTYCPICHTQFSFFVRKHHCR